MKREMERITAVLVAALMLSGAVLAQEPDSLAPGGLIPASAAMETAWDIPRNPLTDSTLRPSYLTDQIRRGFEIFNETPAKAARFSGNALSCGNCHLNAGQRERALPMVGVAAAFPEYNKRQAVLISLEDRIVGCFLRSLNATALRSSGKASALPTPSSPEVLAVSSYIAWLSAGHVLGKEIPWRGHNVIEKKHLLPMSALDARKGKELFLERCANCHGEDGQGLAIGDKKPGPLWGARSWNDGAGAARVYTLAGMIRHDMPYADPGSLTDEEAQQIAFYINTRPRPSFPFKSGDYRSEPLPEDAVYYKHPPKK